MFFCKLLKMAFRPGCLIRLNQRFYEIKKACFFRKIQQIKKACFFWRHFPQIKKACFFSSQLIQIKKACFSQIKKACFFVFYASLINLAMNSDRFIPSRLARTDNLFDKFSGRLKATCLSLSLPSSGTSTVNS